MIFVRMNDSSGIGQARMKPDALEIVKLDDESSVKVMMLEFSSRRSEYQWSSRGLVLRWIEGRVFSKVGVF